MSTCPVPARLPLREVPEPNETLLGFLARLAERNHLDTPLWLARLVRIPFTKFDMAASIPFDLRPFSAISGIEAPVLARMAYWPVGQGQVNFLGHAIKAEMIAVRHRRACPLCLAVSPYHQADWDLSFATICLKHAVRLIDQCQTCGRVLGWKSKSLTVCPCGADLRKADAKSVPQYDLYGHAYLHHLLGLRIEIAGAHEPSRAPGFPDEPECTHGHPDHLRLKGIRAGTPTQL